jgi:acyl carrier protein
MKMHTKKKIRQFIAENFYVSDVDQIADDVSLLQEGHMDSTGVMELVAFLEQDFGIKVDDEELIPENLDSLNQIEAFVNRKTS